MSGSAAAARCRIDLRDRTEEIVRAAAPGTVPAQRPAVGLPGRSGRRRGVRRPAPAGAGRRPGRPAAVPRRRCRGLRGTTGAGSSRPARGGPAGAPARLPGAGRGRDRGRADGHRRAPGAVRPAVPPPYGARPVHRRRRAGAAADPAHRDRPVRGGHAAVARARGGASSPGRRRARRGTAVPIRPRLPRRAGALERAEGGPRRRRDPGDESSAAPPRKPAPVRCSPCVASPAAMSAAPWPEKNSRAPFRTTPTARPTAARRLRSPSIPVLRPCRSIVVMAPPQPRTTATGQCACRSRWPLTEPVRSASRPLRPREPTTTRPHPSLASMRARAAAARTGR